MKLKSMMLLAVASGCGLIAMFIFQKATQNRTAAAEEKVQVLVATTEIVSGKRLDETNTEFREYPVSVVPETAVTAPEEYTGKAVKFRVASGDIITIEKLSDKGAATNDIPKGMMAIGIPVDTTMISGGLLSPGDRVDVFVTYSPPTRMGLSQEIKTVLEYVEVFAADNKREVEITTGEAKTKTITLLVSPNQAMMVKLAETVGKLHIAMRSKDDSEGRVSDTQRFDPDKVNALFVQQAAVGDGDGEEGQDDVRRFIDQAAPAAPVPPVTPPVVATPVEPPKAAEPQKPATWAIEIYSGDTKRIEEVPLHPVTESRVEQEAEGSLLSGIKSLFGLGPKKPAPAGEPTGQPQPPQIQAVPAAAVN